MLLFFFFFSSCYSKNTQINKATSGLADSLFFLTELLLSVRGVILFYCVCAVVRIITHRRALSLHIINRHKPQNLHKKTPNIVEIIVYILFIHSGRCYYLCHRATSDDLWHGLVDMISIVHRSILSMTQKNKCFFTQAPRMEKNRQTELAD